MRKTTYELLGVLYEGIKIDYPEDYFDLRDKVWLSTEIKTDLRLGTVLPGMVFRDSNGRHFIVRDFKLHPITLKISQR